MKQILFFYVIPSLMLGYLGWETMLKLLVQIVSFKV